MKKLLFSLLIVSVSINMILGYGFAKNSEAINTTWYRFTSDFSDTIQRSNTPVVDIETITLEITYLINLQQEMFNLQNLPKGNVIVSSDTLARLESLFCYQFEVLAEMKKEIEQNGKISDETSKKYQEAGQSWGVVANSFDSQLKTIDPFAPVFDVQKWKRIFETAVSLKDTV